MLADAVKDEILRALKMDQVMVAQKELMLTLQKHKLVHRTRLLPAAVGPHPANRDGFGLSPRDCHNLLESILQVGFDSTQTSAVCVEVDDRSKLFTFCDNIVKNSAGSLPPWNPHMLKYGSVSGSHLNAALRCIAHEAPHTETGSTVVVNGKLSLHLVDSVDKNMAAAVTQGVEWTVVSAVAAAVPGVCALLQEAGNAASQVARGESEFQVLLRIKALIDLDGVDSTWDAIKKVIQRTKPQCSAATPFMYQFVVKFGQQDLLQRINSRLLMEGLLTKSLGPDFFKSLSGETKETKGEALSVLRHCALAMAYCCEEKNKKLGPGDLKKIYSAQLAEPMMNGQKLILKVRKLLKKEVGEDGAKYEAVLPHVWKFEDTVLLCALDRRPPSVADMECAALDLVDAVEMTVAVRISTCWDGHRAKLDLCKSAAPPPPAEAAAKSKEIPVQCLA